MTQMISVTGTCAVLKIYLATLLLNIIDIGRNLIILSHKLQVGSFLSVSSWTSAPVGVSVWD